MLWKRIVSLKVSQRSFLCRTYFYKEESDIYMKYFKKLIGDRLYLSPRNSEDVEIFTKWLNDFETTDYLGRSGILITLDEEKNI